MLTVKLSLLGESNFESKKVILGCTMRERYAKKLGIFIYLFGVQGIFGRKALHFWVSSINISKLRSLTRVATLLCFQLSPIRQSVASRLWRCEKGHCVSLSRSTCYSDKQKIRGKYKTIYWISFFSIEQWTPLPIKMMMFPIFKSILMRIQYHGMIKIRKLIAAHHSVGMSFTTLNSVPVLITILNDLQLSKNWNSQRVTYM